MAKRKEYSLAAVSRKLAALRGRLKRKRREKPFAEWWAEYKAEERELEERKFARLFQSADNQ